MRNIPATTYRIQFNKDFTFSHLAEIIPYLKGLGVGAIYASPIFRAVPGSVHGYDQVDPTAVNPEIGTLQQLKKLTGQLADAGIGWIQDIVPNHMAFHPENRWLWDVLQNGAESAYSRFFDTCYAAPGYFAKRLMIPFLDGPLDEVIRQGRLRIGTADGQFVLEFAGQAWPVNVAGQALLQQYMNETVAGAQPPLRVIQELVALQHYEPCCWQETSHRINYRRFFTVNGLIAVNVQDYRVFRATHRLIAQLVKEGVFSGLRIDHIDGLADPFGYLLRLRQLVGDDVLIIVEKILETHEQLPRHWPVGGTSGYEFLAKINGVLADGRSENQLTRFYGKLTGNDTPVQFSLWESKHNQLKDAMRGELDNLFVFLCDTVLDREALPENVTQDVLRSALASFIVHCPVYRWYGRTFPLTEAEASAVRDTLQQAARSEPGLRTAFSFLESVLVPKHLTGTKRYVGNLSTFFQRCMQLTGALMAKGLEDTLMYTYNRHIGANEVGGNPDSFSLSTEAFHRFMQERAAAYPDALNATATHDTKRGEDARARLQVLTVYPRKWVAAVQKWTECNVVHKTKGSPDVNDEYFIYQTIWGSLPLAGEPLKGYRERLEAYLVKALREGKRNSDWADPDEKYEAAAIRFVRCILRRNSSFLKQIRVLQEDLLDVSLLHSLAQVVLKFTCPGIPDIYQGCEGWDFSFVDPDNRRPVDFQMRSDWQKALEQAGSRRKVLMRLWKDRGRGQLKYAITTWLANLRQQHAALFRDGVYEPLVVTGRYRKHVLAFARRLIDKWVIVAVPVHLDRAVLGASGNVSRIDWGTTRLVLPQGAPARWRNVLTEEECTADGQLTLSGPMFPLQMAVWEDVTERVDTGRAAGLLLPLFSLPGRLGIGDMGPEAVRFVDFLQKAGQKYWLMLPHNPTDEGVGYSPYSARSAMAGNTLLLSLEAFAEQGWLTLESLELHAPARLARVDYRQASDVKNFLYGKAFRNYLQQWAEADEPGLHAFCDSQSSWLDDYAAYVVLKEIHKGEPWYAWPAVYRDREESAMAELRRGYAYDLHKAKWLQYQFFAQWQRLRQYAAQLGVQLIGDLPFYLNHDSADVWAHRELFCLDENGRMTGMAGVPPDYFNTEGQAWGMPLYRWDKHVDQGFTWWIERIRSNLDLYDLLRLDHFRAFHDYWEIPAHAESAKEGAWREGPGMALFDAISRELGRLPFIAEDLGDIHEGIYRLRDKLEIPGMRVLQFAFGDEVGTNLHAPHLHGRRDVVFTGTHDNNTAVGWYRSELSPKGKAQLSKYIGVDRLTPQQACLALCRLAYASPAALALVPVQDILGLGSEGRMNVPARPEANWQWRLDMGRLTDRLSRRLQAWMKLYGR